MLTLATLIGLAAGFAREWLLIDAWGASLRSDAFLVALFLPEAVRMALATGLFSSAALPLYQEREGAQREAWLSALTWRVLGVGLLLAGLFYLAAPQWVWLIGPGLSAEGQALAWQSLHLLAWCIPGFMLHALLCIPLQAHARFVLAGLGSLLFNLPPVLYLALKGGQAEPAGVALSCLVGSLLMPLLLFPAMRGMGWRPWRVQADRSCGQQLLQRLGPLLASTLASQGLPLLERMIASVVGPAEPLVLLLLPNQAGGGVLAALLGWLSLTLLFAAWNALLARYAYSVGDTRLPLACELSGNAVNALLLLALPWWLGLKGIALAALCGVLLTGLLLMRKQRLLVPLDWPRQWTLGGLLPALALAIPAMMVNSWWQLGVATLAAMGLMAALAALLRPWRIH